MKRKELERWARTVDWSATYTCRRCGKTGPGYYVQPQPEGGALCGPCIAAINREMREARRRALEAMPRCAVPECNRRATYWHPDQNGTGLCGHHWRRAEQEIYRRTAGFPMFGVIILSRDELIRAATAIRAPGR